MTFFIILSSSLTACSTAGNMGTEVSSWFHPQQATGTPIQPATAAAAPSAPAPIAAHPAKVALLLPLSGDQADLGKNLQDGAQLAVLELGRERFELMPRDSGATPQQAATAARIAIHDGAQLIIGPLFGHSVNAVKAEAAASHVPVLALSNDWTVAGNGAFVLGFSPVEQVRRIGAYAGGQGLHKLGVLAPASSYGDLVIATLKEPDAPVEAAAVARYQNNAASLAAAVEALVKKRGDFQAVFIPEGGPNLRRIAALLSAKGLGVKQMPWLGTGLWDEAETLGDPALQGAWYAAPDPAPRINFVQRYTQNFGKKPARLASLAYDATALAEALAGKGRANPFNEEALTNPNGFAGLDGIFRLTPQGVAERGLAVLEIHGGAGRVVDPAPKKF